MVILVVLTYLMNATRTGKALRAVAEDTTTSSLLGIDTDRLILLTFIISGFLGGVTGTLVGLSVSISGPYFGIAFGLKGLAVIVLGGFGDIPGAVVGGLVIGLAEAFVPAKFVAYRKAVRSRCCLSCCSSARGDSSAAPESKRCRGGDFISTYDVLFVAMVLSAVLALSLYLPFMAGQLSVASPGFYALGGYIAAVLSTKVFPQGKASRRSPGAAGNGGVAVISGMLGIVVGMPALRLRGIFLALATIAFVQILGVVALNLDVTGGAVGIFGIPQPFSSQLQYLWVALRSSCCRCSSWPGWSVRARDAR